MANCTNLSFQFIYVLVQRSKNYAPVFGSLIHRIADFVKIYQPFVVAKPGDR